MIFNTEVSINGQPSKNIRQHELFATFYFLSDNMISHSREKETFLDILSKFGGMSKIILSTFNFLGLFYNQKFLYRKIAKSIYIMKANVKF
jgi:hypothetical protein